MIWVIFSGILFGLVHPGSKIIMGFGVPLTVFCFFYVGLRLLVQIPLVLRSGAWKVSSRGTWIVLFALGLVGAGLQLGEFYGIAQGLPVPLVTFLVYTHPVWTLLLARAMNKEKISRSGVFKVALSVVGIALITGVSTPEGIQGMDLIVPLFAGLMIALWITLSNRASKAGASSLTISFYYDLFCFLTFCVLQKTSFSADANDFTQVLKSPKILACLFIYSTAIGFLPNFLFYHGSKKVSSVAAGFVLLLEPVISSAISFFIWGDHLEATFFLGAFLILSANIPTGGAFLTAFKKSSSAPSRKWATAAALALIIFGSYQMASAGNRPAKELHFIEIVPPNSTTYNVRDQLREMELALNLAAADFEGQGSACKPKIAKTVKVGPEDELFKYVQNIGRDKKDTIVFGFSRSDFARVAAKALIGSGDIGLSVGASAPNLRDINPNFYSIASPLESQFIAIHEAIKRSGCKASDTLAIFDQKSFLSEQFLKQFRELGAGTIRFVDQLDDGAFNDLLPKSSCIFISLNFSESQRYLGQIMKRSWSGYIFGTGDWNIFSAELIETLKQKTTAKFRVLVPTGWLTDSSSLSKNFSHRMKEKLGKDPSPISAYTYDAAVFALESACGRYDIAKGSPISAKKPAVLRSYEGVSSGGNYLSKMQIRTFYPGGVK